MPICLLGPSPSNFCKTWTRSAGESAPSDSINSSAACPFAKLNMRNSPSGRCLLPHATIPAELLDIFRAGVKWKSGRRVSGVGFYAEGVGYRSPGSRSAPWVAVREPLLFTPKGLDQQARVG